MDYNTKAFDVKNYLETKLNVSVVCYKLDLNNKKYASFYISLPAAVMEKALSPEIWPNGCNISTFGCRLNRNLILEDFDMRPAINRNINNISMIDISKSADDFKDTNIHTSLVFNYE